MNKKYALYSITEFNNPPRFDRGFVCVPHGTDHAEIVRFFRRQAIEYHKEDPICDNVSINRVGTSFDDNFLLPSSIGIWWHRGH